MESRKKRRNTEYMENKKGKNNKWKIICLIMLAFTIFVYYQVYILINYTIGKEVTESQISIYKWMVGIVNKEQPINKETSLHIAVIGNIKAKGELLKSYMQDGIVDYGNIFENISFEEYDYTIASLNTAIVSDTKPNGDFYANSKLIKQLKDSYIDMLITSTKELAEQSDGAVEETLKAVTEQGMDYVGASKNNMSYPYYILNKNDIKVAILAYVDEGYTENKSVNVYSKKQLKKDIKEVKKEDVDAVIVFIDTLRNNQAKVKEDKNELLQEILEQDVNIVISSDTVEQKLYQNTEKDKYIKYSLGDVIGLQETENGDVSKVLKITINKEMNAGKSNINFEVDENKTLVALSNSDMTKYKVVDLDREITNFDETSDRITVAEYNYLKKIKENLK